MYQYGDIATKGRTYTAGAAGDDVHAIKIGFQMQIQSDDVSTTSVKNPC